MLDCTKGEMGGGTVDVVGTEICRLEAVLDGPLVPFEEAVPFVGDGEGGRGILLSAITAEGITR